jgi:hypothetical protein
MKRILFRFSISFLTFAVGFGVVWLAGLLTFLFTPVENKPVSVSELALAQPVIPIPETSYQKPRFTGTYRGCYPGYVQGYETDDGQQLSEGITVFATRKETRAEFKKWIAKSVRVVERVPNYKNRPGKPGERVVIINPPNDRNAEETVSILWYGGDQIIAFIDAPSLDLALEFEQFLEATGYTAHGF